MCEYVYVDCVECFAHVVVCLSRPMEGIWGGSNFQIFSQNCQFHHMLLESLEHLKSSATAIVRSGVLYW